MHTEDQLSCGTSVLTWGAGVPLVQSRGGGGAAAFASRRSRIHQKHLLPSARIAKPCRSRSLDGVAWQLARARGPMSTSMMVTLFRGGVLLGILLLAISGSSTNCPVPSLSDQSVHAISLFQTLDSKLSLYSVLVSAKILKNVSVMIKVTQSR